MSDSLSALYLTNPELAIALRRRADAGQLLQQGLDYSPVRSPFQGLSRVANALMGAYDQKKADEDLKTAVDAGNKEVADFGGLVSQALMGQRGQPAAPPSQPLPPAQTEGAAPTGGLADRIVGAESGGNPNARSPMSSATGAGQFIDSTWLSMMRKHKPEFANLPDSQILSMRSDPMLSRQMVQRYAEENGAALGAQGLPVNDGTTYLAHWFGPAGAASILKAPPGTPMSQVMPPEVLKANPTIAGMTTDGVAGLAAQKVGGGVPRETQAQPVQAMAPPQAAEPQRNSALMDIYMRGISSNNPRVRAIAQGLAPFIKQDDEAKVLAPGAMLMDRQGRILAQNPNDPTMNRINLNNDMRGPTAFEQDRGKALAERVGEWDASWEKAQQTIGNITAFRRAMQDVQTGIGAGAQITLGQVGQRLGVPETALAAIGLDPKKVADLETIRSMSSKFLLDQLGKGGFPAQNFSNADREMLERALPGLANTPQGNEMIMSIMEAGARRQSEIGKAWREFASANGEDINAARRFQREVLPKLVERDIITPIFNDMKNAAPSPGAAPPAVAPAVREGATATNPQTGQKLIFRGGAWVPVQ